MLVMSADAGTNDGRLSKDAAMQEKAVTLEQIIAYARAAMEGADALNLPLAGNHIAAGLDILRAAQEKCRSNPQTI